MHLTGKIFKIRGRIRHYAWGGYDFIPSILGETNEQHIPFAEYWMGAHPADSSTLVAGTKEVSLFDIINEDPTGTITEKVYAEFGELPYLLKIMDVREMLSIQVHPSKEEAIKGFEKEEAAGIPVDAPHRNYKDKNHKPEMLVALSEFWLLHGFRQSADIEKLLEETPEFNIFLPLFKKEGYRSLYQIAMEMRQQDVDAILTTLVRREQRHKAAGELTKEQPGWWVCKLFEGKEEIINIDRGVFSIYFFNIVKLEKGEGIFQSAGIPHAYLEGQCMELMANSDNVLRGGLTPKHVDVKELMDHTLFEAVTPVIIKETAYGTGGLEKNYPCPVPDFGINKIELSGEARYTACAVSMEILIAVQGGCVINGSDNLVLKQGEAVAILPGEEYFISASGHCLLFKAFVPG